jgi:hypothetical protein
VCFRLRQVPGREPMLDVIEQIIFRDAAHGASDATAV